MSDPMEAEKGSPSATDKINAQRRESTLVLGELVIKEQRLAKALEDVRVKIAAAHDDIMALDKALALGL